MVTEGKADAMFLLECVIHDRISNKWKNEDGHTEIIYAGSQLRSSTGKVLWHQRDFNEAIAVNLKQYVEKLSLKRRYQKAKAPRSIPQIPA